MLKIMMMKKMLKSVMKMKWSHDRSPSCANRVAPHNTNSVNLGYCHKRHLHRHHRHHHCHHHHRHHHNLLDKHHHHSRRGEFLKRSYLSSIYLSFLAFPDKSVPSVTICFGKLNKEQGLTASTLSWTYMEKKNRSEDIWGCWSAMRPNF